jgi:Zn-dependent protease
VRGSPTIKLGRLFGIRIGVSAVWFLVLFVVIWYLDGYFRGVLAGNTEAFVVAVVAAILFFATVVAHELGHALVARRLGMEIDGVDLWALGGFTRTRGAPESPGAEFALAAGGPAVNVLVVAICVGLGLAFGSFRHFLDAALLETGVHLGAPLLLLSWLALINTVLLIFNLLPALPLDGGRIARAVVWKLTGDADAATRACARLGQMLGFALIGGGIVLVVRDSTGFGLWCVLIGLFIGQSARQSLLAATIGARMRAVTVGEIMDREPVTVPSDTTLLDAREHYLDPSGAPWLAVTDPDGRYRGMLIADRVAHELRDGRPALTAAEISEDYLPIRIDASATLETALRSDGLRRLGAMVAVDGDGILRGVVTLPRIRRAMHPSAL